MSVVVELSDVNLSGSVILGFHKTTSGGALAREEELNVLTGIVLHGYVKNSDELAACRVSTSDNFNSHMINELDCIIEV